MTNFVDLSIYPEGKSYDWYNQKLKIIFVLQYLVEDSSYLTEKKLNLLLKILSINIKNLFER